VSGYQKGRTLAVFLQTLMDPLKELMKLINNLSTRVIDPAE